MKNKQVTEEFLINGEGKTQNLFFEKDNGKTVLYSYGYHFPLCVKLDDGYLFNIDGYSITTAKHKGDLARSLGYSNFAELEKTELKNLMTTKQLKDVIRSEATTKTEIIEQQI